MATLSELRQLFADGTLRNRIEAAAVIAAGGIVSEDPGTGNHAARLSWARDVLGNPRAASTMLTNYVLAAHAGNTPAQILAAPDSAIKTAVDAAVNALAT